MAGETNPKSFYEVCPTINPPVDEQVAPATQQPLQQVARRVGAHARPHRVGAHARPMAFPSAKQQSPSSAAVLTSASGSTDQHKCAPKQLPATAALLPELSSPLFGTDSESPQDVRGMNDHLTNRVRKRSPEAQTTRGHTSQARDTSDELPLTSSDNVEEQGSGEDVEHDGPRKSTKRGRLPKTKRPKVEAKAGVK